jgi:DNA-binding transcriptional regulator GbsR (MarR family)
MLDNKELDIKTMTSFNKVKSDMLDLRKEMVSVKEENYNLKIHISKLTPYIEHIHSENLKLKKEIDSVYSNLSRYITMQEELKEQIDSNDEKLIEKLSLVVKETLKNERITDIKKIEEKPILQKQDIINFNSFKQELLQKNKSLIDVTEILNREGISKILETLLNNPNPMSAIDLSLITGLKEKTIKIYMQDLVKADVKVKTKKTGQKLFFYIDEKDKFELGTFLDR